MAVDSTTLLGFLKNSLFLSAAQVDELTKTLGGKLPDGNQLCRELVRRGWLTSFQARELLQGQGQKLILGPYRLLELLGEGGMGLVYKARHVQLDRLVALKVIHQNNLAGPRAIERFYREVKATSQLSHPNIVQALEAAQVGDIHYLAMEFVEGIDLDTLVKQKGPLPIAEACASIRQAALGLQHAHERGLVHRDIKPHNLLVSGRVVSGGVVGEVDGGTKALLTTHHSPLTKILDFGLARFASESGSENRLTQLGSLVGTVDYISPEQAEDPRQADIRSDLYSLGCTLYYLLTGRLPFPGADAVAKITARLLEQPPSVRKYRPEAPPALEQVLHKIMARKPAQRYQTPAEVAAALQPFTQKAKPASPTPAPRPATPVAALAPSPKNVATSGPLVAPRRSQPTSSRKPWLIVGGAGAALAAVILMVILAIAFSGGPSSSQTPVAQNNSASKPTTSKPETQSRPLPGSKPETEPKPPPMPEPGPKPVEVGTNIRRFERHAGSATTVAFSKTGLLALSGGRDKTVRLWDVEAGKEMQSFKGHADAVAGVAFCPDGRCGLSAGVDGTICLWDLNSGAEVRRFDKQTGGIKSFALSRDGRHVLTGSSEGGTVCVWDVDTGKLRFRFKPENAPAGKGGDIMAIFYPDSRRAISSSAGNTLHLWDLEDGREGQLFEGHTGSIHSLAVSSDGRRLLSGGADRHVILWDIDTGKEIRRFDGHTQEVLSVAFSPDDRFALSGSADRTIRLWDVETGSERGRFNAEGAALSVAFAPDGRTALSAGGGDGLVRLWSVAK